jgi:hypothetical protein
MGELPPLAAALLFRLRRQPLAERANTLQERRLPFDTVLVRFLFRRLFDLLDRR